MQLFFFAAIHSLCRCKFLFLIFSLILFSSMHSFFFCCCCPSRPAHSKMPRFTWCGSQFPGAQMASRALIRWSTFIQRWSALIPPQNHFPLPLLSQTPVNTLSPIPQANLSPPTLSSCHWNSSTCHWSKWTLFCWAGLSNAPRGLLTPPANNIPAGWCWRTRNGAILSLYQTRLRCIILHLEWRCLWLLLGMQHTHSRSNARTELHMWQAHGYGFICFCYACAPSAAD